MALIVVILIFLMLAAIAAVVAIPLLLRRSITAEGKRIAALEQGQSGPQTIQEHAGELAQLERMSGELGVHLDLADDLGTKVPGAGMQQPTHGTLHVVGRSAPDPKDMRGPCTIAYAIESPAVASFSGEQIFEAWTAQWPEPGDTLPCVYDAANPSHVDIDWQQVATTGDTALADAQALADELNRPQTPPAPTPPVT